MCLPGDRETKIGGTAIAPSPYQAEGVLCFRARWLTWEPHESCSIGGMTGTRLASEECGAAR